MIAILVLLENCVDNSYHPTLIKELQPCITEH